MFAILYKKSKFTKFSLSFSKPSSFCNNLPLVPLTAPVKAPAVSYASKVAGIHSHDALVNILWFNNCLHLGLRGGKDQRDLEWDNIELKTDLNGKEYLEYSVERQTKTEPGDNPANRRSVKPKTFENKAAAHDPDPVFPYKPNRSKPYHQSRHFT